MAAARYRNGGWGSENMDIAVGLDTMDIDSPQQDARMMMGEGDDMEIEEKTIDEILPEAMLMEILSRLPDARDLVRCAAVNHVFRSSFTHVRAARFVCRHKNLFKRTPFKRTVVGALGQMHAVEDLRLEIEEKMQGQRFKEDELDKNSLWVSEADFVAQWVPPVSHSLRHLCLIDYGQQAIFKKSPLVQTLSTLCPNLQTLDLRNMYLDCTDCRIMSKVTSLTLRCVKLTDAGLEDIGTCMPNLKVLTLVTVVGLKEAVIKSDNLEVLCLGLSTPVNSVKLELNALIKLQLKMNCPKKLKVKSPSLKSLALCMGQNRSLEFEKVTQLEELLMGAAEFSTLMRLSETNADLKKVFLDIPCMKFGERGELMAVLQHVELKVPDMAFIRDHCPNLQTLSIGPGLWYAFEQLMTKIDDNGDIVLPRWPTFQRVILHMIALDADKSWRLLRALSKAIPALAVLEVYVHESSTVAPQEFGRRLELFRPPNLDLRVGSWKKGLKFGCFSF